jgi:nucleoid-associated protein YgaU
MTRETKVGLLAGTALILLIGILVSDHLSIGPTEPADSMVNFAPDVQRSINNGAVTTVASESPPPPVSYRREPLPLPQELPPRETPVPAPTPAPNINPAPDGPSIVTTVADTPSIASDAPARNTNVWADLLSEPPILLQDRQEGRRVYHTVKAGQTLSDIATEHLGSAGRWREVRDANPDKVTEQGWVREGVRLIIPLTEPQADTTDVPPVSPAATANRSTNRQAHTATVREGQSLSKLAQMHLGSTDRWREIYELNRDQLRSPDRVMPGMVLRLPDDAAAANAPARVEQRSSREGTYTVRSGDTLSSIAAAKLGDPGRWYELYRANQARISDPDALQVGAVLTMPR